MPPSLEGNEPKVKKDNRCPLVARDGGQGLRRTGTPGGKGLQAQGLRRDRDSGEGLGDRDSGTGTLGMGTQGQGLQEDRDSGTGLRGGTRGQGLQADRDLGMGTQGQGLQEDRD